MRQSSFLFLIVEDWNSLPDEVVSVKTFFSSKLGLIDCGCTGDLMTQKFIDKLFFFTLYI